MSRSEFENAITLDGKESLKLVLLRDNSPGLWTVVLDTVSPLTVNDRACLNADPAPWPCFVMESAAAISGPAVFKNLTFGLVAGGFRLSGSAIAARSGQINSVETDLERCASLVAPSAPCTGYSRTSFTRTTLASPVAVAPSQQIAVTVDITFN